MQDSDLIELSHGAGGKLADELLVVIKDCFTNRQYGSGIGIDSYDDGGTFVSPVSNMITVITTDGHSVHPLFFPGGNIGVIAATGTINDTAVMGAEPLILTSCLLIEEGFNLGDLKTILRAMDSECVKANVSLVAGDTKVLPKGTLDELMIATTAVGYCDEGELVQDCGVKDGDLIIVSNSVGSHGIALMSYREGISFSTKLESDVCCILPLIKDMKHHVKSTIKKKFNEVIHAMKDPTRGGLASAINEFAAKSGVDITLYEDKIPVEPAVKAASEMLGLDVFSITSEGCFIGAVQPEFANDIIKTLKRGITGRNAAIIGKATVKNGKKGKVYLETVIGGRRILHKPLGELIPRVC
ncbi:MAG: hydrogenase expression/formation protein HypE [Candidatus Hodarchaeales archaeon]|jgi:hydrogenase expression/formation protein HypE